MNVIKSLGTLVPLVLLLPGLGLAQETAPAGELDRLRSQIAAQQKQIDEQKQSIEAAQRTLDEQRKVLERLAAAPAAVAPAPAAAPAADPKGKPLSPLAFHIGGADFTPGGFADFSNAWRSTNVGTGVATSFGAIPFSNTPAGRSHEFRSSGQNSRLTLKVTANPTKNVAVTGYAEVDFAGNQATSVYVTSNSNTLRMRQFWVNVQKGKWEVLGGQAWTLMTPNRVGVSTNPADIFLGVGQDANYLAGLVWGRQGVFRLTYHPSAKWSLAASIENPEQYVTAATTLPSSVSSQIGNGSASSTPNARPDVIVKAAYDTKLSGRAIHLEAAGVSRQFNTSPAEHVSFSKQALGASFNGSLEVLKNCRLIFTSFYSSGGGRYLAGLSPDLAVGPDGSISPVHSMSGIGGMEYQVTPSNQVYAYYSGAYIARNYSVVSPGSYLGFGFPGSSSAANRQVQEATFGYSRTFWKSPNYGALQMITQYAYVSRAPWSVATGTPSTAHSHMVFAGMRFTLP